MGNMTVTSVSWDGLSVASYGVLILPFLSFLINGLWLGRKNWRASAWTATFLMGGTFMLALMLGIGYRSEILGHPEIFPAKTAVAWEHVWMSFGNFPGTNFAAKLGFYMDPISIMMVLVISFISFLVHFYSIGYMDGDKGAGRFFPLLSFFSFSMLGLVVSSNLVQTFFFWELVGAASYLLIGFWYTKPSAVAASKKAFVLTRVADAFFLMGVLTVGWTTRSFDFIHVNSGAAAALLNHYVGFGFLSINLLSLATLAIYMGAWGKSAMFPFHVWLPDAMEGPTPVSSLIHSATMVVAGIYLTARLFPLFAAAEGTLRVVEVTGAFTALFAALIACTQTDLKRILAFSTLSQLGMMMFALGTGLPDGGGAPLSGAYTASMFHIFTHAFFKCLLFLSAGVVIHAIHSNDIRDAGGLRKSLPKTYWGTLIAVAAIAGIFPFSGFWSKEEILHAALAGGHYGVLATGLLTSGLTAFYMTRYFVLVFHGDARADRAHAGNAHATDGHADMGHGIHEGFIMTLPILVLAIPSAVIGFLSKGFFGLHVLPWAERNVADTVSAGAPAEGLGKGVAESVASGAAEAAHAGGITWVAIVATLLAVAGVAAAWYWYGVRKSKPGFAGSEPAWYKLISRKFYIDEGYLFLVKRIGARLIAAPINWFERTIINGAFDLVTGVLRRFAFIQSWIQNGQVQIYIGLALLGLFLLAHFGKAQF